MKHTLESATKKVSEKGIILRGNGGHKTVDMSKARNVGIKTLGVVDYLIKQHGYRKV